MSFFADALRELLDELNASAVTLVGHSMGGIIAQEFYRKYPQYIRRLVLADTTTGGGPKTKLDERLRMIRTMTPAQLAEERAPKLLSCHASPELVREAVAIMSEVRPAGYEFAALAMAAADTRDVLKHLNVPALLIWGAEDEITPLWAEIPKGARLEVIRDAGHLCYMEQPAIFNSIVRRFLLEANEG